MKVAIIGGGASGFFAAINVKENYPQAEVCIFEKTKKLLSKVKVSGGGRCNVTNAETSIKRLTDAYPRGSKPLKKAFKIFSTSHMISWLNKRGVELEIQQDLHVFPKSQNSQTIIDCFLDACKTLNIPIHIGKGVKNIVAKNQNLYLEFIKEDTPSLEFDKVIVAIGGTPKRKNLEWLEKLGHKIEEPIPSLFTFNMPDESITKLMGIVVEESKVSVQSTKLKSDGPLLITHWGMSGPAILKLSAFGARILEEKNYQFKIQVNWVNELNNAIVLDALKSLVQSYPQKQLQNYRPYKLPLRLWHHLLQKTGLSLDKKWQDLGKKGLNKLVDILAHDIYRVSGKTTFKEEFVTCGGISFESIDSSTMQSKVIPNLYFAGEVMNIDGITGGYNFQSCWTSAFIAAKLGD